MTNQPALLRSGIRHANDHLIEVISPWIRPLGYQIISLEVLTHRQKTLRLYIDHLEPSTQAAIGIEDCVKVSRTLEEPLDQSPEIEAVFPGGYELEVSSPGVDRPLRTHEDFCRFVGEQVRIHVFRALTQEELKNLGYFQKNPKQKNFLGILAGIQDENVQLTIPISQSLTSTKKGKKSGIKSSATEKSSLTSQCSKIGILSPNGDHPISQQGLTTNSVEENRISIPLPLISKANLEPSFDFEASEGQKESKEDVI